MPSSAHRSCLGGRDNRRSFFTFVGDFWESNGSAGSPVWQQPPGYSTSRIPRHFYSTVLISCHLSPTLLWSVKGAGGACWNQLWSQGRVNSTFPKALGLWCTCRPSVQCTDDLPASPCYVFFSTIFWQTFLPTVLQKEVWQLWTRKKSPRKKIWYEPQPPLLL